MTLSPAEFLLMLLVTASFVIATVAFHYEALLLIQRLLAKLTTRPRIRIGIGVVMALVAHAAEAWLFALGYWLSIDYLELGSLGGAEAPTFLSTFTCRFTEGLEKLYRTATLRKSAENCLSLIRRPSLYFRRFSRRQVVIRLTESERAE